MSPEREIVLLTAWLEGHRLAEEDPEAAAWLAAGIRTHAEDTSGAEHEAAQPTRKGDATR